ncbi:hypothetical protein [Devosia sp. FJ2-5-3]|uniref:hypothetical protein n=1 Tax=Devosia sp. FJ2-5-3 TaxID=2976680 RepID=UPI0023D80448|nr:hypothetical protein [Devosia sp. FJ2-5-3]WEJ56713.1 hypothetical protein N0P34_10790 [Devosia sp. FJ2-5-3]
MPKKPKGRRYAPAPNIEHVTTHPVTGMIVRGPMALNGVGDDRDPFAHQILPRQKRKHESIRGSEARFLRTPGASLYTGIAPVHALSFASKAFESSIEGDFWTVSDFVWPDMTAARSQPGLLSWESPKHCGEWYPDSWVRRPGHLDRLIECKPVSEARPDKDKYPEEAQAAALRFAAMEEATAALGMRFTLYTELEIRSEPRFHNAKAMRRALSSHITDPMLAEAAAILKTLPEHMTVLEFSKHLGSLAGSALNIACLLDRYGGLHLDRSSYFLPRSRFQNLVSRFV